MFDKIKTHPVYEPLCEQVLMNPRDNSGHLNWLKRQGLTVSYQTFKLWKREFLNNGGSVPKNEEIEKRAHINHLEYLHAIVDEANKKKEEATVKDGVQAARTLLEHDRNAGAPSQTYVDAREQTINQIVDKNGSSKEYRDSIRLISRRV